MRRFKKGSGLCLRPCFASESDRKMVLKSLQSNRESAFSHSSIRWMGNNHELSDKYWEGTFFPEAVRCKSRLRKAAVVVFPCSCEGGGVDGDGPPSSRVRWQLQWHLQGKEEHPIPCWELSWAQELPWAAKLCVWHRQWQLSPSCPSQAGRDVEQGSFEVGAVMSL